MLINVLTIDGSIFICIFLLRYSDMSTNRFYELRQLDTLIAIHVYGQRWMVSEAKKVQRVVPSDQVGNYKACGWRDLQSGEMWPRETPASVPNYSTSEDLVIGLEILYGLQCTCELIEPKKLASKQKVTHAEPIESIFADQHPQRNDGKIEMWSVSGGGIDDTEWPYDRLVAVCIHALRVANRSCDGQVRQGDR